MIRDLIHRLIHGNASQAHALAIAEHRGRLAEIDRNLDRALANRRKDRATRQAIALKREADKRAALHAGDPLAKGRGRA